jgi:riboflavin biosynthesis pyrimidine reductase
VKVFGKEEVDFHAAFRWLRAHHGVKRLLCEGGGDVNDGVIRAGLLDELYLTISPRIFGGRTSPTISEGTGFSRLAEAAQFRLKSWKQVGAELFLVFARA